jgi:glycerol-3-phosphate acyltransferase PlsY
MLAAGRWIDLWGGIKAVARALGDAVAIYWWFGVIAVLVVLMLVWGFRRSTIAQIAARAGWMIAFVFAIAKFLKAAKRRGVGG